jgi:hypothetical protein
MITADTCWYCKQYGVRTASWCASNWRRPLPSCGVPQAMLMDHGIPWWSARALTGATRLTAWLMKQGIQLHWSGFRHPQTQGKVERFHGALERALQARGAPRKQPQPWLDAYRWEHNHVGPHEALSMQTPASVWRKSERSYDPHPPRWEYPTGARVLKVGVMEISTPTAPAGKSPKRYAASGCNWTKASNESWCTTVAPWSANWT